MPIGKAPATLEGKQALLKQSTVTADHFLLYHVCSCCRKYNRKERTMQTIDFRKNTERALLENMFYEWAYNDAEIGGNPDLKEWFEKYVKLPEGDSLRIRFEAFAGGVIAGLELAERLQDMEQAEQG